MRYEAIFVKRIGGMSTPRFGARYSLNTKSFDDPSEIEERLLKWLGTCAFGKVLTNNQIVYDFGWNHSDLIKSSIHIDVTEEQLIMLKLVADHDSVILKPIVDHRTDINTP